MGLWKQVSSKLVWFQPHNPTTQRQATVLSTHFPGPSQESEDYFLEKITQGTKLCNGKRSRRKDDGEDKIGVGEKSAG